MEENNKFYVGQEVLCINDTNTRGIKKGDKYIINAIKKGCCTIEIDLGVNIGQTESECVICGRIEKTSIAWYRASRFIPIDNELSELTSADILQEEPETQNI